MDHACLAQCESRLLLSFDFYNIQVHHSGEAVKAEKPIRVFEES